MKHQRHPPEQAVHKFAESERILNGGGDLATGAADPASSDLFGGLVADGHCRDSRCRNPWLT